MNELKYRFVVSGWDDLKLLFNADEYVQATTLLKIVKEHIVTRDDRKRKVYLEAVTDAELSEEEEEYWKLKESIQEDQRKENEDE